MAHLAGIVWERVKCVCVCVHVHNAHMHMYVWVYVNTRKHGGASWEYAHAWGSYWGDSLHNGKCVIIYPFLQSRLCKVHHNTYLCSSWFICIPKRFQRLDSLNTDGRLANGAGNQVKRSTDWSQAWDVNSLHCASSNIPITANIQPDQQQKHHCLNYI